MKVTLSIAALGAVDGAKADAFKDYLKEKLPKTFKVNTGEPVEIEAEAGLKDDQIRLLAKKFLAREKLTEELRVVTMGESLAIKNRRRKRI